MQRRIRRLAAVIVAAALLSACGVAAGEEVADAPVVEITPDAGHPTEGTAFAAVAWVSNTIEAAQTTWYFGVEAARQAAIARAAASSGGSTGSGYHGPHSDAWWQGVAQCEQGGRNDEYFGYFSFMDGSQGGKPWAEQVAAGNALLARAGREVGPWAASCVASGYRASPGG